MGKKVHGHGFQVSKGKAGKEVNLVTTTEPSGKRKTCPDMEGTTKRSFGLGDSIKTFLQGR